MLSSGFAGVVHAGPGSGSLAVIDAGIPTTYAFNEATVSSRRGISGTATISGTSIDGVQVKLFETTVGFAESLTATYYAWPELASITFEGVDGDGLALAASVSLRRNGGAWSGSDAETLASLEFPFRLQPFGNPPRTIPIAEFAGAGPKQAARIALARLFVSGRRAAPLIVLALWTIALLAAAKLWHRKQALVLAALACVAFVMTAAAFALGPAPAELFAVPVSTSPAKISREAGAESALLFRQVTETGNHLGISWSPHDEEKAKTGGLWFIGIRSPQSAAVPVSVFDSYRRLRFKTAPLVVSGPDGQAMLAPAPFALAWALHE